MQYSEIIYLINMVMGNDSIGNDIISSFTKIKCYAKKQSLRTNEYYSAVEAGLNPEVEFVVKRLNYNGESEIEWNNERYSVIRTIDPKNKFDIVLICEKKIGIKEGATPSA